MEKSLNQTTCSDVKQNEGIKFDILPLAGTCLKLLGSWLTLWGLGYYKFSPSWVALGAFGYIVYSRAQERRALISGAMKAIGANEKRSILTNIGAHELPSWVYFPDIERAEWLNKVIQRLWPFISDYINEVLISSVEPTVNTNLPSSLQPFKFLKIDLGDTPPRIGGVKVYTEESIRRDEIVMDLDIMLYSDAQIKVSVGKIIAGVKNFELRGTLRVLMKPLVPKIPFAGAVTVCFLDNPYINFLLTHVGNLLTMPGLQQTLNRTIQDAVSSLCVLPNRVSLSLVDNVLIEQLKFPSPQGVVRVNVISASDLMASDVNVVGKNTSDPYCVVRVGAQKFITAVKKKTLNPGWNECFEAIVDQRFGQSVQIEVWDEDKGTKDDELGLATIPIENIHMRGEINTAVVLEGVKSGKVHLKMTWLELSSQPGDLDKMTRAARESSPSERVNATSYLFVRVEQAKNLMRLKFMQEPSPYCVLQLGNCVQNTVVKEKTQNPLWESVHHFLFSNADIESLNIEIRDSRTETVLGNRSIPLKHLIAEPNMTVTRPYTLKTPGSDDSVLTLHMELRALVPGVDNRPEAVQEGSPSSRKCPTTPSSNFPSPSKTPSSVASTASSPVKDPSKINNDLKDDAVSEPLPPTPSSSPSSAVNVVRKRLISDKLSISSDATSSSPVELAEGNFVVAPPNPVGRLRLTLYYNSDLEILEITVHRAEALVGVEKDGLSDPYVKLSVINANGHVVGDSQKTKVVKNDLNPVFEESFDFSVKHEFLNSCKLSVEVKNHVGFMQRGKPVRIIGLITINLRDVDGGNGFTEWYWMKPANNSH